MSTVLDLKRYLIKLSYDLSSDYIDGTFNSIEDTTFFGVPLSAYVERAEWIDENIVGGATINEDYQIWDTFHHVFVFSDNDSLMIIS